MNVSLLRNLTKVFYAVRVVVIEVLNPIIDFIWYAQLGHLLHQYDMAHCVERLGKIQGEDSNVCIRQSSNDDSDK